MSEFICKLNEGESQEFIRWAHQRDNGENNFAIVAIFKEFENEE